MNHSVHTEAMTAEERCRFDGALRAMEDEEIDPVVGDYLRPERRKGWPYSHRPVSAELKKEAKG